MCESVKRVNDVMLVLKMEPASYGDVRDANVMRMVLIAFNYVLKTL